MRATSLLLLFASLFAPVLRAQSAGSGIINITPQQCVWRAGDNLAWAAPDLDESGWQPYTNWKLDPSEPHIWVRCHADLSFLRGILQPAVQVSLLAAYQLYVDGVLIGSAGDVNSGNFNMDTIRSHPLPLNALYPTTIAVRITYRLPGLVQGGSSQPPLGLSAGAGSALSDRRAALLLANSSPHLIPALCFSVLGVIGAIAFGVFLYDPSRRELLLLSLLSVSLAWIYLDYFLAAALIAMPSSVYLGAWSCFAMLLGIVRPVFFFSVARRRVPPAFRILIALSVLSYIAPACFCTFLPPTQALWIGDFNVRYMRPPGNFLLMTASAAPFFAFWPYSRITRRMGALVAMCFLFGATLVVFFFVRATGMARIPGIPNLASRWGSAVSEAEALVLLCVMTALFALLLLDQRKVAEERAVLAGEMHAASTIQRMLAPASIETAPGLKISVAFHPMREVGGDFYLCRVLPDGRQRVLLGDVSGKGAAAAMAATLILGAASARDSDSPAGLLAHLNCVLRENHLSGFATCLCADVASSGQVAIANAGHLSPYRDGREIDLDSDLPLGVAPNVAYAETMLHLGAGESLAFVSDGVVEARNKNGELFGFDRTQSISTQSAESIARTAQAHGQEDDITVLTLTFAPAEVLHA